MIANHNLFMNLRECSVFALALTFLAYGAAGQCPTAPGPLVVPALGDARETPPIGVNKVAQTFVAPGSGCLQVQSVQVMVAGHAPEGDLVVSIYTVATTGAPGSPIGGSTSIPVFSSGDAFVLKTAEFKTPVEIAGGTAYAVVFSEPAATKGSTHYTLQEMQKGPYATGMVWIDDSGWASQTNRDIPMTVTFTCCSTGCTRTQGYWKNHYELWPAFTTMMLGSVAYTPEQLEAILQLSPGSGQGANGLISMAHQLIGAKLNILAGASQAAISSAILAADTLIGSQNPLSSGYLPTSATGTLNTTLTNYNEGVLSGGPPHCQ